MRVRTIVDELGCTQCAVSDARLLNRDVVVSLGSQSVGEGEDFISLAALGAAVARRPRTAEDGILLVYVKLRAGESLDDLYEPPSGVVLVGGVQTFNEVHNAFRHLPEVNALLSLRRARLHESFLHSYDIQQFADRAEDVIGNPLIVTNTDHRLLAFAGDFPRERADVHEVVEQGYMSDSVRSELKEDGIIADVRLKHHAVLVENPRLGQRWVHSIIYAHHMELGRFDVLESDRAITPIDLELIDYAGSLAGVLIERLGMAGARVGAGSSVLRDLINGSFVNEQTMRAQVAVTSLPLDESYVMLAVVGQRGAGSEYYTRAGQRVGGLMRSCLWCVQGNVLAVLVPLGKSQVLGYDDYERAKRQVLNNRRLRSLLENNDMRAFVSEPFDQLTMAPGRFSQALELMDATFDDDQSRMRFYWEDRYRVLARNAATFEQMDALLDKRVIAMSLYDHIHGTQYFETAVMSVEYPGSPADAARALNVHRNTYFYRVNKVRELFFIDLKDGDDRLALAFTSRIMDGLGNRFYVDLGDEREE